MGTRKQFIENNNLRILTVIRLITTMTVNGASRAALVVVNSTPSEIAPLTLSGGVLTAIKDDHGCGRADIRKFIKTTMEPWHTVLTVWGPTFKVPPSEFNAILRHNKGLRQAAVPRDEQQPKRRKIK
jgi:hypothetical protein